MITNNDHFIKYTFRAVRIPLRKVYEFQKLLPDIKIEYCKYKYGKGQVMLVELNSKKVCKLLLNALNKCPLSCEIGVRASLVTEYDSDGLRMPLYISEFFREVGGRLDFSFTLV